MKQHEIDLSALLSREHARKETAYKIIIELRAQLDAAIADLKEAADCELCKYNDSLPDDCLETYEVLQCDDCVRDCKCGHCKDGSNWDWRGKKND